MFTKLFSKCDRFQKLCIFEIIVLVIIALTAVVLQIQTNSQVLPSKFSQATLEKRAMHTSDISQKASFPKIERKVEEPEKSFESFVTDEVLRVCTDIYPDLDPNYILAIIYHESRFKPDAVNLRTNATGLMQVLPKWHAARAQKLGVSLTDPAGNILVGCDILNEVYQQSHSLRYALNVYAGGYSYANNYKNTKSQFEKELDEIIASGVLYSVGR